VRLGAELTARLQQACDRAEAPDLPGRLVVRVTGTPERAWTDGLTVTVAGRWERAVRRMERLAAITIADGACGGVALDVLLAADVWIATSGTTVQVPVHLGTTWPGSSGSSRPPAPSGSGRPAMPCVPGPSGLATIRHPGTGEELWFNQADQWHPATLGEDTMRELASIVSADELLQSVAFADGSPIPAEYVTRIRDAGLELAYDVNWQQGDILLVGNLTLAHGRRPYSDARRVFVARSG
jgi:hypothetical protein